MTSRSIPSVAVVGGGFGGVGTAAVLEEAGYDDVTVLEREERIGGVWQTNTYPGLTCDVPSALYSYSFAPNPRWSRRFSPRGEIQAYLEDVARRYDVERKVRLGTEVERATFDEPRAKWVLETSAGRHEADVLVAACGQLAAPRIPALPGLDEFAGPVFHTGRWRDDVDLRGLRVAVVGTGASAIQAVPAIQPIVGSLTLYQRSAPWVMPKPHGPYPPWQQRLFERFPATLRAERQVAYALNEVATAGMTRHRRLLKIMRGISHAQRRIQVRDPELRRRLVPDYEIGCKRLLLSNTWYPALQAPNVELVMSGVERLTSTGVVDREGRDRPADVVILATGFQTQGFVAPMEVVGRGGRTIEEEWAGLPKAYLGLSVPRFPNLFLLYGPNTNGGAGSAIAILEAGIAHVLDAVRTLDRTRAATIEVTDEAAAAFDAELRRALEGTVWHTGCSSWYVDAQGRIPNQWPWLAATYKRRTARIDAAAYRLSYPAPAAAPA